MSRLICFRCQGHGFIDYGGAALRTRREKAGISLREMARLLKLSAAYLSDVELERRRDTERVRQGYLKACQ